MTDAKELLERAKRLKQKAGVADKIAGQRNDNTVGDFIKDIRQLNESVSFVKKCVLTAKESVIGLYQNILTPIGHFLNPVLGWAWRGYKKMWDRCAYVTDKTDGVRKLSRKRAGALLTATFMAAAACTPTGIGGLIRDGIGEAMEPVVDTVRMVMPYSYQSGEKLYLSDSALINPKKDIHSVKACTDLPCDNTNSVTFRVKPSIAHTIWSQFNQGTFMFMTDRVVNPIAPGQNECKVTSYGYRWRVAQWLEAYPYLLDVQCKPLKEDFSRQAAPPAAVIQQQSAPAVQAPALTR